MAASTKERKKEVDCAIFLNEERKNMRRGKPQMQLYTPGSGPLRKSFQGIEETEQEITNMRQNQNKTSQDRYNRIKQDESSSREDIESAGVKLSDMSLNDRRRSKKPEQKLYIAKHRVAHELEQQNVSRNVGDKNERNLNGNNDRLNTHGNRDSNRGKRYSNRRRNPENPDIDEEWRAPSPNNRNYRQGSEPRTSQVQPNNGNWNRTRDTRSVEPQINANNRNYNEKNHPKPPSGRRHSTIGVESTDKRPKMPNIDHLPPRLQKKFLDENKINYQPLQPIEDSWDGSSITFQGSIPQQHVQQHSQQQHPQQQHPQHQQHAQQQQQHAQQQQHPQQQQQHPQQQHVQQHPQQQHPQQNYHHQQPKYNYLPNQHVNTNNMFYYTLPSNKPRGRGRLQQDYHNPSMYRSMTPDKIFAHSPSNSRPQTPTFSNIKTRSTDNLNGSDTQQSAKVYRNDGYDRNQERYQDRVQQDNRNDKFTRRNEDRQNYGDRRDNRRNRGRKSPVLVHDQQQEMKTPVRAFRDSLEAQLSPVSPPTPAEEDAIIINDIVPISDTLDWSEEVEMHVKNLEEAALSDALTRSSSMASLMDINTKSMPNSSTHSTKVNSSKKKKNRKNRRSGSSQRDRDRSLDNHNQNNDYNPRSGCNSRDQQNRQRQNSHCSVDSNRDIFKVPDTQRQRRHSREHSYDRKNSSRIVSRDSSFERNRKSSCSEQENTNWRDEIKRNRNTVEREVTIKKNPERETINLNDLEVKKGGILLLPTQNKDVCKPPVLTMNDRPQLPDLQLKLLSPGQKSLFDPNNPHKPIIVNKPSSRVSCPGFSENNEAPPPQLYTTDQYGNLCPTWYKENSESFKSCHYPNLLIDIKRADNELQHITNSGCVLIYWSNVLDLRVFLMGSLKYLICRDLKFSQSENIEQHFWKILYHNIIKMARKAITSDSDNREHYKVFLLNLIDEGTKFYEQLLSLLETTYNFKLSSYLGNNSHQKGVGYIGLALISAQKIYICLGDLGRYREEVNDSSSYGKCRQLYIKAHDINPKNARPYNQLAVLAVYSRKKLDAVYYYMRSLMSSNPLQSTREALINLFDENRKKYEHGERKRREERLEKSRLHMKEKESEYPKSKQGSLRKETWIRPNGGRRVHRTTSAVPDHKHLDSDEEDLASLSSVEVNKRFVTSYLHVHGKLITKIGIDTFQETALQMLKEFRALLQHSPVPLPYTRFLQLLALNMFAIESTQLKDPQLQSQTGYRSELQERALVVSIQMFSLILEKCVSLLHEHVNSKPENVNTIPLDAVILLPSVKVWCDWMLCHSCVWNPPPSTQDFRVGPAGDAWTRLASLMNLLERLDQSASANFASEMKEGYELIRLPEDGVLSGFTPLMYNMQEPTYVSKEFDMEAAQFAHRLNKILFFGTVFLCGLEPPVLKLEYQNDMSEYISVVCTTANRSLPSTPPELNELLVESESGDEESTESTTKMSENAPSEIKELLTRKVELEKRQRDQELHRQTVQKILQQSVVSVHIEIKPKNLVPDTNCFIDYLSLLKTIAASNVYTLMVPLVVLNELEGLAKGSKSPLSSPRNDADPQHVIKVAEASKLALEFLGNRQQSVKCITTKGTVLTSTTFTKEDDTVVDAAMKNDDKILATCLTLCKGTTEQVIGEPRKLQRDIVLLTEDRNLRVKALARDVPVREVPNFLQWAGLG